MNNSNNGTNARVIGRDVAAVLVVAVLMKLTSGHIMWTNILEKDTYAIVIGMVMALSFAAYIGMVYGVNRQKLKRLRNSVQFKNITRIMLAYMVATLVVYLLHKLLNNFGLLVISAGLIVSYRLTWIYWRTVSLL